MIETGEVTSRPSALWFIPGGKMCGGYKTHFLWPVITAF